MTYAQLNAELEFYIKKYNQTVDLFNKLPFTWNGVSKEQEELYALSMKYLSKISEIQLILRIKTDKNERRNLVRN